MADKPIIARCFDDGLSITYNRDTQEIVLVGHATDGIKAVIGRQVRLRLSFDDVYRLKAHLDDILRQ